MNTGPAGFHFAATLRLDDLSAATRAVCAACSAAPDAPQLVGWLDAGEHLHEAADAVPGDARNVGLAFGGNTAFGVIERGSGACHIGVNQAADTLNPAALAAALQGWADVCRALLRSAALQGARLTRIAGGHCVPSLPLVETATHLVACSAREVDDSYTSAAAFASGWDSVEIHGPMRLYLRAMGTPGNPEFLAHILPGHMAMARAARPGLTRFFQPAFEPGELEILEAGEPTLTGIGYFASDQIYEFAGHAPRGTDLRCVDLLMAWKIAATGKWRAAVPCARCGPCSWIGNRPSAPRNFSKRPA